ncbi:MAG: helix-turn-helix transcriptional regulator [Candidatus Tectomicrobia bacterium]|nr:helix-turn-helix transcriptional regulator [Candidatus Tectomicrobia bacterium]
MLKGIQRMPEPIQKKMANLVEDLRDKGPIRKEEIVNIFETDWYQEIKSKTTPGDNLRIYRENHGLTQAQLGAMLGGIPRQYISNMERGMRLISIKMARKLAKIFKASPAKFI